MHLFTEFSDLKTSNSRSLKVIVHSKSFHTGLVQHEAELMMTEFSDLGELSI